MSIRWRRLFWTFVAFCITTAARGQWVEQTVHLEPGWNSVFFEVDPQPRDCDAVFQGVPVKSVWAWNRYFTTVQFVQDPGTLLPDQPEWLTYFPTGSPDAALSDLFIIRGGRSYLVNLGGDQAVDLTVKGRPRVRPIEWMSDSYNLVGFHVAEAAPPTFGEFFASSAAHAGQEVYRLGLDGDWHRIDDLNQTPIQRGHAYWMYCKGQSTYQGPLEVDFDYGDGLDYARIGLEHSLEIRNLSGSDRTVVLLKQPSAPPANDPALPVLAGEVPLAYYKFDVAGDQLGWIPLNGLLSLDVPAGGETTVRLAVQRAEMAPFTPPADRDYLYQSLLTIADGAGSLLVVPVSAKDLRAPRAVLPTATEIGSSAEDAPPRGGLEATSIHPYTGLWVGTASINAVSNPTSGSMNPDEPTTVAAPATFRLIVHVDSDGQARLLQQVLQMWKEGAWIPNPDDPTSTTFILDPNNSGRTVLLTDDSLIPEFGGVALRDTKLVGRRISSAVFGFTDPIDMGGAEFALTDGNRTTCVVVCDYQDRLNPFQHRYHPDHDNWDPRYSERLPEGKESYTIIREIGLDFTADDPEGLITLDWGGDQLGGIYTERIQGIHRRPVHIRGYFRLHRISDVGVLNDGR
jgi:hypothetical protein